MKILFWNFYFKSESLATKVETTKYCLHVERAKMVLEI